MKSWPVSSRQRGRRRPRSAADVPVNGWPPDFPARRRGDGCTMCGPGADETPHGLRVFEGQWADGYIGRHPVRPGYSYVIWKGRHVAEPTELSANEAAGFWSDV